MTQTRRRIVLVTGASMGIGACCAAYLSERDCTVYAASRSAAAAPGVVPLAMDVTNDASVSRAIATILEQEGTLDVLVNNAGFGVAGAVEDTSVEEAVAQFEVNFFGMFRVCRAVLPVLRRQGAGYIINISSIGGLIAIPFQGFYSASKFALEGLSESLRLEVRPFGIRVVLIEPGDHRTSFTGNRRRAAMSAGSSVYKERFERALARMSADEQGGPAPDGIARLVYRVINYPDPRLRYTVGPCTQRAAPCLKRFFPNAVIEKIMRHYYACK